jgi:simple sugar transport system ATP-binding protein
VLFLDEPTAVLAPAEVKALFATLRAMADDGKAIALVTHKLGEIFSIADRTTIMRGGKVVASAEAGTYEPDELARLMVGREVDLTPRPALRAPGEVVLSAEGLMLRPEHHCGLQSINLHVRAGEILGVAGVAGNGQLQLAEVLAGLRSPDAGTVRVGGVDITDKGPRAARRAGLAYVPEDRLGIGLAPGLSISDNLQLTAEMGFLINSSVADRRAQKAMQDFSIKARGPSELVRRLSGGNVQKVLLARELGSSAKAFVIASPARGLDVAGIEFVRNALQDYRDRGAAILLISEDLDEVRDLADRIAVMFAGQIAHEAAIADFDEVQIGRAMAGTQRGARLAEI